MQTEVRAAGQVGAAAATVALTAGVLVGCSATDSLMSSVTLSPAESSVTAAPASSGPEQPGISLPKTGSMTVTARQREYLDALDEGGVRPSSDLLALQIGSYVCQAHAARQADQAVWDFVYPMVSADVDKTDERSVKPDATDVDAATRNYIRIATERLC